MTPAQGKLIVARRRRAAGWNVLHSRRV